MKYYIQPRFQQTLGSEKWWFANYKTISFINISFEIVSVCILLDENLSQWKNGKSVLVEIKRMAERMN